MSNYVYVDNSNVWIEGKHVSAVVHGYAPDIWTAMDQRICDYSWKIDFGKLLSFSGGAEPDIGRAVLYGSRPPANDSLWAAAERCGFEVVVHDRNAGNREKKIDTSLTTDVVADSYELMKPGADSIVIVSGDTDYVPAVERLIGRGFNVEVHFWEHAGRELREACSRFVPLNPYLDHLRKA